MKDKHQPDGAPPYEDRDDDLLYLAAPEVERDVKLNAEMAEWEAAALDEAQRRNRAGWVVSTA